MQLPTNVTKEVLFDALARFGPLIAAELGYFNALVTEASVPVPKPSVLKNVRYVAPPTGQPVMPATYGYATIDLTPYNLSEPPVLSAVVLNPIDKVDSYAINFQKVTNTSAVVHVHYDGASDYVNLPSFNQDVRIFIG